MQPMLIRLTMQVSVIGTHGGIGRQLVSCLVDAGHNLIEVVRDKSQFDGIRKLGSEPRLGDLEEEFASALQGLIPSNG